MFKFHLPLVKTFFFSFLILFSKTASFMDAPTSWQIGLQAPATPIMEGIINFHNHIMFFVVGLAIFVGWLLSACIYNYNEYTSKSIDTFTHATEVEVVWTVVPAIILIFIAIPSFSLLYSMDEMLDPAVTIKVIGHQWYWTYEYSDYAHLYSAEDDTALTSIIFDSYMLADDELREGQFRLLEVDNRMVVPVRTHIRLLITSADVLHSWAVPSFGIKVDACPGRLNQTMLYVKREGVFYGQCSEICGINHGFMPICVEVIPLRTYKLWVEAMSR